MDMQQFIQNEYDFFLTGKLSYQFILLDSFLYLLNNKLMSPSTSEVSKAYCKVREDRIKELQANTFNHDGLRTTFWTPATEQDKRKQERKFMMWHTMQLLVYRWYEEQKKAGIKIIHAPEAPLYKSPMIQYASNQLAGAFPLYALPY